MLDKRVLEELRAIVGDDWVVVGDVSSYLYDETPPFTRPMASKDALSLTLP